MSGDEYLPRLVDGVLAGLLADVPGVLIVGARATGKTTTAARFAASVVHLDRDEDAAQFRANPDVALAGMAEPVLLDEWQAVPGVLGAVKTSCRPLHRARAFHRHRISAGRLASVGMAHHRSADPGADGGTQRP